MAAHQAPPSLGFSRQEHWSGLPFPSPMHESEKWKWSRSVVSNSLPPDGMQPTRLLCPRDSPGRNIRVGCHALLKGIFPTWTHVSWVSCIADRLLTELPAKPCLLWDVAQKEKEIKLGQKAMAPHSSAPAWKIPWTEEPGRLQSMGSLRVGHNWATSLSLFTFMHWRRKWQSTPVFLPGESQGWGSLVGCRLWGHTESDMTEVT